MAYCLGLIPTGLYQNLVSLGTIRNLFAHSHEFIDFNTPAIVEECNKLTLPQAEQVIGGIIEPETPRERFMMTTLAAYSIIHLNALSTTHREPSTWKWPAQTSPPGDK
jgi:hypothetical protein